MHILTYYHTSRSLIHLQQWRCNYLAKCSQIQEAYEIQTWLVWSKRILPLNLQNTHKFKRHLNKNMISLKQKSFYHICITRNLNFLPEPAFMWTNFYSHYTVLAQFFSPKKCEHQKWSEAPTPWTVIKAPLHCKKNPPGNTKTGKTWCHGFIYLQSQNHKLVNAVCIAMMITMKCMMFNSVSVSKVKNHIKWQPKNICIILDKNTDQMCSVQVTTGYRQEIQPKCGPQHSQQQLCTFA